MSKKKSKDKSKGLMLQKSKDLSVVVDTQDRMSEANHKRIKKNIENTHEADNDNNLRFHKFRNLLFVTSISQEEIALLTHLKKPVLEFNVLEAYVSRLLGEFSKQEPSIKCSQKAGKKLFKDSLGSSEEDRERDVLAVNVIEAHVRHVLDETKKKGMAYNVFKDTLSGGFSSMKVLVAYLSEMSMDLGIFLQRTFEPTLTGFDALAAEVDKSDAQFCFETFPYRKDSFMQEFEDVNPDNLTFAAEVGGYQWSYVDMYEEKMVLVADYYEKEKVKTPIVGLANGETMRRKEYEKMLKNWDVSNLEQPPAIVSQRVTTITKVYRYKVIEDRILSVEETDFKKLPLIFVDGNSVTSRHAGTGSTRRITRPYHYNAVGAQRLKNYAGQNLANELENLGPAKIVAAFEALHDDYLTAYKNPQEAIVYVYNAFKDNDPNVPVPAPIIGVRPPIPPEISETFMLCDTVIQNVLGSFDATMAKLTNEQVSGIAVQEGITLSNASAMPYVVSYLRSLESAAESIVQLIPLYYKTPRSIPVMTPEGRRSYIPVNKEGGTLSMDYDPEALEVTVEAGVNFNIQQTRALQQIIALMNSSPLFGEFINDSGLDIILDNVEIRGIDSLRMRSEKWMAQMKQAKAQAQQQAAQQPGVEQMTLQLAAKQVENDHNAKIEKLKIDAAEAQSNSQIQMHKLELEVERIKLDMYKAMSSNQINLAKLGIDASKHDHAMMETLIDSNFREAEHEHNVIASQMENAIEIMRNNNALQSETGQASPAQAETQEAAVAGEEAQNGL